MTDANADPIIARLQAVTEGYRLAPLTPEQEERVRRIVREELERLFPYAPDGLAGPFQPVRLPVAPPFRGEP